MGFILDGLNAESYDRERSNRELLIRIVSYFRPARWSMLLVAVMIVAGAVVDAVLPIMTSRGVDALGGNRGDGQIRLIVVAILVAGALSWTCNFIRQWISARTVGNIVLSLRRDAFDAVMARDMSFYDQHPSGKVVSRVTSDSQQFSTVVTLTLDLLSQALLVVLIAAILFYVNIQLALATLAIAPVIVAVALGFRHIARRIATGARRVQATVNATVQETIRGIGVAKGFRQEQTIYDEFTLVNAQSYGVNLRQGFVFSGIFPILNAVAGIGTVIVIYFGGVNTMAGEVTAGEWYFFVQSIGLFWFPMTGIASFWSQFQLGLAASERVFALIDAEPRVVQVDRQSVERLVGRVEFADIGFEYVAGSRVLDGFNLQVDPGETVALVGHTGAGKSSLAKLLVRFYEFQSGRILIDGKDIRTFDLSSYRQQLGIVSQVPFLFRGTVADNVRYANPDASQEDVRAAVNSIGNGDWLAAMTDGLDTAVGEMGTGLSMGQRQLVVLARVLLQNPAMIILDEATASIDPLTEAQIQEGLDVVMAERTAIVIAHRLSTIRHVDRIIVLREGRILEEGDHDVLIAAGGHYCELYNTYFRHQSPDYRPGEGFVPLQSSTS